MCLHAQCTSGVHVGCPRLLATCLKLASSLFANDFELRDAAFLLSCLFVASISCVYLAMETDRLETLPLFCTIDCPLWLHARVPSGPGASRSLCRARACRDLDKQEWGISRLDNGELRDTAVGVQTHKRDGPTPTIAQRENFCKLFQPRCSASFTPARSQRQ